MARPFESVSVWDVGVRGFHWSLLLVFTGAYLSAEFNEIEFHEIFGYGLIFLIIFRIIWGFVGSPYARFRSFIFSPRLTLDYIQSLHSGSPAHYLGHNPLGALMVFTLLACLNGLAFTGLITLAGIEFEGPLLSLVVNFKDELIYLIQDLHEILATVMLVLISLHVAGVVLASMQHKENLIISMFTGKKKKVQMGDE